MHALFCSLIIACSAYFISPEEEFNALFHEGRQEIILSCREANISNFRIHEYRFNEKHNSFQYSIVNDSTLLVRKRWKRERQSIPLVEDKSILRNWGRLSSRKEKRWGEFLAYKTLVQSEDTLHFSYFEVFGKDTTFLGTESKISISRQDTLIEWVGWGNRRPTFWTKSISVPLSNDTILIRKYYFEGEIPDPRRGQLVDENKSLCQWVASSSMLKERILTFTMGKGEENSSEVSVSRLAQTTKAYNSEGVLERIAYLRNTESGQRKGLEWNVAFHLEILKK